MILLAHLKFCWRILNFAGVVFEIKVTPAKDPRQQNSAGTRKKIPSLKKLHNVYYPFLATRATSRKQSEKPRCRTILPKKKKHSLHVGWRNFFPVVLLCQFFGCGGK
jgi:hypothetical protein